MKKKLKQIPKTLLLCLIVFFTSCNKDELYEADNLSKTKATSRYVTFNELKKNQKAFGEFQEVEQKVSLAKSSSQAGLSSRLVYLSQYNFSIDTDKILLVEKGDYKSYTFPIYRDEETEKTENLVITEKNNEVNAYLSKYTLTEIDRQKIENKEYVDLINKTEVTKLQNQTQGEPCYELVSIPVEWNEQGQVTVSMVFAIEVDCGGSGGGGGGSGGGSGSGGGGSSGGGSGSGSGSGGGWSGGGSWGGGGWTGGGWTGGGSGSGGDWSGGGGGGGSTGGGGYTGGGSTGGGSGSGGPNPGNYQDPSLSDWDGSSIVTYPVIDDKKHKKALNKLTTNNSDGTETVIKQKIDDLKSRLATDYKEDGAHFIKNGSSYDIRLPIWRGDNQVAYSNGDQIAPNTKVVIHMHQNQAQITQGVNQQTGLPNVVTKDLVPIWSDGDIDKTAEQFGELNNDEDFTSILVTQEGTFALRVGNSSDLNDTNLTLGNDPDAKEKLSKNFNDRVLTPCNGGSNSCYVQNFIIFLNTYTINGHSLGLILYEAVYDNQGNIINWIRR